METSVSIVIVSYNVRDHLERCLLSLGHDHEIIVVDNASKDGSAVMVAEKFPSVKLIQNQLNRGFGPACNQGISLAQGQLILLLNPDCVATDGSVKRLTAVFADPNIVAAGGRLEFQDGSLQHSACRNLDLWAVFLEQSGLEHLARKALWLNPYWRTHLLPTNAPSEVEQVMGACLMFRPVALFDERFFLYCEDTELCLQLRKQGRILYEPRAVFRHALGQSSTARRWYSVALYNRGKELYFSIHRGEWASQLCWLMHRFGAGLRLIISIVTLRPKKVWLWLNVLFVGPRGPGLPPDAR